MAAKEYAEKDLHDCMKYAGKYYLPSDAQHTALHLSKAQRLAITMT